MSDTITHPTLPITAPANYWRAGGYTVYTDGSIGGFLSGMDSLLMLAIAAGKHDEDAIAWAMAEKHRRSEESARNSALVADAAAICKLADALRQSSDDEILQRILSRLSERTQCAVRQQLADRSHHS